MSDFKLTEEQQAIMDVLERDAKEADARLTSPEWKAKNERRHYLIDKSNYYRAYMTSTEAAELEELQKAIGEELGMLRAPDLYRSAISLARAEARLVELKAKLKQKGAKA